MIFLWNCTNEDMDFTYGGLSYTLLSGKRLKVDEAMGRHVLNNLGARGMTRLDFDEDGHSVNEDKISLDALDRNREFKIRQIVTYNERNERRKASNQPYDTPSKVIKQYAAELGIELLQPYTLSDGEKGQIGKLSKENEELRLQMATLMNQMQQLMGTVASPSPIINKNDLLTCEICGEKIPGNRMKSHIHWKHNPTKGVKNDTKPVPI